MTPVKRCDTPRCMTGNLSTAKIGFVPNQPKTPARAIRIDDATWDAVKADAQRREETATDVVRRALAEYLRKVEKRAEK